MKKSTKRTLQSLLLFCLLSLPLACDNGNTPGYETFSHTIQKTSKFIIQTMAEREMVGLSIALVSDDRIAWAEGFGWADRESGVPAQADTAYMLGSGSKTLTTVALLQLADLGLLSLDNPATAYLPDFRLADRFANQMEDITVRRLLNHHSGIPGDIYNGGFVEMAWNQWGCELYIDWLINYLSDDYPSYAPGELSVYCNTAFVLAGEIALRLGGRSAETFNEFMIRQLFHPLAMNNTSFMVTPGDMAVGYIEGEPVPHAEANCVFSATGGAVTTVLDMGRFLIMMLNHGRVPGGTRIIAPETVELMGQGEKTPLDLNSYSTPGLGLDTMDDPVMRYAGRAWSKNGSTGHFNSFMEMLPDEKLAVIVLTNSDTAQWAVYSVARECLKNAVEEKTGIKPSLPPYPELPSEADPGLIVGTYVKKNGYDRILHSLDGNLFWTKDAHLEDPDVKVLVYGENAWKIEGGTEKLTFRNISFMGRDHFVMVQMGSDVSIVDESVFEGYVVLALGEKLDIPFIPPEWLDRTGRYWIIDNIPFNDLNWDFPFLALEYVNGVLMVRQGGNLQVILPQNENLAFAGGLANRNGSCVQVRHEAGMERLVFVGYEAYPIGQVPVVSSGDLINSSVDFHKTNWYRFNSPA
ncbi:MAG: beta-lactamase family protein, partial [Deltaproteobacteria bacterium]|nr:beta-lactamase family protein [Deltaproteobacteria bacterium]